MENEVLDKSKTEIKTGQGHIFEENKKISREAIERFRTIFRTSQEKLKEYGVREGLIDENTPLEEVRPKLIEKIKELNERKAERRAPDAELAEERRKSEDRRQPR